MPKEVIILISIALTMVPTLAFVFVALRRVSHPLASAEAREGSEWRLGMMAQEGRKNPSEFQGRLTDSPDSYRSVETR